MKVNIIYETELEPALLGLGFSYGITSGLSYNEFNNDREVVKKMFKVSKTLYLKGDGHNKFLESIGVYLDITAPRYWWQEFDTYRVGVTKQSESTIHTITQTKFTKENFSHYIPEIVLTRLNFLASEREFEQLKAELPEGFLQRRVVCCNYKVLRHVITQRHNHKLKEWRVFCDEVTRQVKYPYLDDLK